MAYNPAMYQTYGNMYGNGYGNSYGQQYPQAQNYGQTQQSYGQNQTAQGIIWVDGEVGAKAFQMPGGWMPNTPIPLWDTNDTIIYLKSVNQMGMPNPLQKIVYKMEEQGQRSMGQASALLTSGDAGQEQRGADMSQYVRKDEADGFVRKDDLERMKTELMESIQGISAANGPAGTQGTQGTTQGTARRNTKGE